MIMYSSNETGKPDSKSMSGFKLKKMLSNIMMILKFVDATHQLDSSIHWAHLRVLCVLNPNKCYSPDLKLKSNYRKVTSNLQKFLESREKFSEDIFLIFNALNVATSFDAKIIEKLFFNILINCNIKIDNVIPYILNLNADEKQNVKKENINDDYYSGEEN